MTLEIPVTEGAATASASSTFAGNDKVPGDMMRPLFKLRTGDFYNEKRIREGIEKIKEIYGAGGHFEMTPYPEFAAESDEQRQHHDADARKASSTSSTASPSWATRRLATTSSDASCGCTKTACSTPRR